MICGYGSWSIDWVVSNSDSLYWDHWVFGTWALGLGPVVGCISTAVCVVPGVVCHNGVP